MNPTDKQSAQAAALRRRAEALLPTRSVQCPADLAALSPEEIRRMFDELQLQQIELELQNDELRRTQRTAQSTLFRSLRKAPVAYCTLNAGGSSWRPTSPSRSCWVLTGGR
jgi:hypothetical protein